MRTLLSRVVELVGPAAQAHEHTLCDQVVQQVPVFIGVEVNIRRGVQEEHNELYEFVSVHTRSLA